LPEYSNVKFHLETSSFGRTMAVSFGTACWRNYWLQSKRFSERLGAGWESWRP